MSFGVNINLKKKYEKYNFKIFIAFIGFVYDGGM
jgi:hypothetical protein